MPGFKIDFLTEYTDEALLNELRRVAELLSPGEPLTRGAFKKLSPKVAYSTIGRRFGGWKESLEKAGLAHLYSGQPVSQKMRTQSAKSLSNADILAELQRVYALIGKGWLTTDDFNTHSNTSEDAVRLRFGTFRNGLEAAGIPPHPLNAIQFTDEQCFENIALVWTHFGRSPTYREMFAAPSTIQGKTYVIRWGTWRKTLKAFVDWANAEEKGSPSAGEVVEQVQSTTCSRSINRVVRTEADNREVRPGLRFKVFMRDRFRCVACGRSPATHLNVELHADHINAVANGGKTILENLQTLCEECNLGKGKMRVG